MRNPISHSNDEPLERKSLKEEVFEYLHARIIAGDYTPGDWLRQEDLASQLKVSQTPVREALDLLVSVGLAQRVPYRGVRVTELSHTQILDAYETRLLLEVPIVRLACRSASSDQVLALQSTVEQTRDLMRLEDMSLQRQLNKRLHFQIAEASGNQLLSRQYEVVANMFPDWLLYEYMFRHPELLEASLREEYEDHNTIVTAIAAGDELLAVHTTLKHLTELGTELVDFLGVPGDELRRREERLGFLIDPTPYP